MLCFVKSVSEMELLQVVQNPGRLEASSHKASGSLVPRRFVQVEARKEPRVLGQVLMEGPFGADRRTESA